MTTTHTHDLGLYAWQDDALAAWHANGCRGIVEAVTGTGKTRLGLAAIGEAHEQGLSACVGRGPQLCPLS